MEFTDSTLNDLAEITSSKRIYLSDYVDSGVPFFRSKEIIERFNHQETSVELFISEKKFEEIKRKFGSPKANDILITSVGTLGIPYLIKKSDRFYFKDGNLIWFRNFKDNIFQKFLFLWLCSGTGKETLVSYSIGSSQPAFTIENLKKVPIKLPSLSTQKKIAAVLSAYDELIENNKRRIAILEKMAEEIYREWFVRLRFPGHENTKFEKGLPEDWKVAGLETLCVEIRKRTKKKDLTEDVKYVGLEHMPRKSIAMTEIAFADSVQSDKFTFIDNDILFGKIRPYLHKIALAPFAGTCSSDIIVLRSLKPHNLGFVLFTVFSESFVDLATVASKGTKMPRADWDFLKKQEMRIPDEGLLCQFQAKIDPIFDQIKALTEVNRLSAQAKNLLLPRLISGKLSVEDLDIQFPPSMIEEDQSEPEAAYA